MAMTKISASFPYGMYASAYMYSEQGNGQFPWTLSPRTLSSWTDSPGIFLPSFEYDIFPPRKFPNYHNHFNQCIHTYMYTCTYIQPYMDTYIHTYIIYVHTYIHTNYICIYAHVLCMYVRTFAYVYYTHPYMHICIYNIHAYQYTCIHTYTKAFDTIRHQTLLQKLCSLAPPGHTYNWVVNFFQQ